MKLVARGRKILCIILHTCRFEHCLGTAHLCGKLIDTLHDLHRGKIEITDTESLCIKIAGLCHDLGHGPFSHFFDGVYIPRAKPGFQWKHEQASCDLFEFMIASNPGLAESFEEYDLGREEIDFIKELILGWCTCLVELVSLNDGLHYQTFTVGILHIR